MGSSSQGSNLGPLHWEHGVLPTTQPGKFPSFNFNGITLATRQSIYISWIWSQGGKSGRREARQEGWWWLVAEDRPEAEGREDGLPERQEAMWQEASVVLFCSTGFKSLLVVLLHV